MPGRPDLGLQSVEASKNKEDVAENAERECTLLILNNNTDANHSLASKPAFKLAAYGVKQGGIGSVLAGGFPVLKKTGGIKKTEEEQVRRPRLCTKTGLAKKHVPKAKACKRVVTSC